MNHGFPGGSAGKESTCNVGDLGSMPRLGRSAGEENSYQLWGSGWENSMDCIVHGVTKSQTWLSHSHFHFHESYMFLMESRMVSLFQKLFNSLYPDLSEASLHMAVIALQNVFLFKMYFIYLFNEKQLKSLSQKTRWTVEDVVRRYILSVEHVER